MPDLTANGVRFNMQRVGSGDTTIVMLHGMLVDNLSSLYLTLAPTVADRLDVVLYDLRGHGRSERPAEGYRLDDAVADLIAVLDELDIHEPVYLLGNSYGGTVAMATALAHPDRVAGLILIEAHFSIEGWGNEIADTLELAGYGLNEQDLKDWLGASFGRKLNRITRIAESLLSTTSLIDDLRVTKAMTRDDLRSVTCPVLAIYGEHSDVIERALDLDELVPNCELDILDDCSHSTLLEATPTVRQLMSQWFDQVLAGAAPGKLTRRIDVSETEGEGKVHAQMVDMFRAELRRRKQLVLDGNRPADEPLIVLPEADGADEALLEAAKAVIVGGAR